MKPSPQESVKRAQAWSTVVLLMEDSELMAQGDDLDSHIAASADEGKRTVEDGEKDTQHGVAVCHGT